MYGCFRHAIDAKGRLFMPAKLRETLGFSFYVTIGADNCLAVYSSDMWGEIGGRMDAMPISKARNMQRMFFSWAAQLEPDGQGRVLLPQHLRAYAGLKKDAVVAGVSNHVEIWDAGRWDELESGSFTAENLISAMDELGL